MSKKTMAQEVLQKLKEKKELLEKTRPHYQIYRLQATFAFQLNRGLRDQIARLDNQLVKARQTRELFDSHLQEFQMTGKKDFPRIVVKPQFIASDNVLSVVKEFYRKSSNNFLKVDLLRNKKYFQSLAKTKTLFQKLGSMKAQQQLVRNLIEKQRKINNEKRMKVLRQDLRLREIRKEQKQLRQLIAEDRQKNKQLIKQYDVKKGNLQSRKDRLKTVLEQISACTKQIEQQFNPVAYRQHLKTIFDVGIKNECILKNLELVQKRVSKLQRQKQSLEKICQKANSLCKLGRTSDSPSFKKRANHNTCDSQKQRKYSYFNSGRGEKTRTQKSSLERSKNISQNSTLRSMFEVDSLKNNQSPKRTYLLASERRFPLGNKSDFLQR